MHVRLALMSASVFLATTFPATSVVDAVAGIRPGVHPGIGATADPIDRRSDLANADTSARALPAVAPPRVETIAEGLEHPWSIAFLPDGRQLVTERAGRLRVLDGGRVSAPLAGVPTVFAASQGGLFDVVLHPDHTENGWLYLSYAHGTSDRNATRLARARLDGDALSDLEVLFTAKPWKATPVHHGGRVAFAADGTLLMTIGDGFDHREAAQRWDNHFGKIVRLADDGGVPADNPLVEVPDALPEIWSYGHRNPQGLAVTPDGRVFEHEHGPAGGDEINRLNGIAPDAPGPIVNYGWPVATHGRDYSGAAISPYDAYPGTAPPLLHWTPSIAPSGLAVVSGPLFPELAGELVVAALKSRELRRVRLDAAGQVVGQAVLLSGRGRLRDVRSAPDGSLWVLVDAADGAVLRLTPGR